MIIDAHYHLDERLETMERLLAQLDHHGIDRVALIPTMVDPFQVEGLPERLAGWARRLLVGRHRGLTGPGRWMYRATVTRDGYFSVLGRKHEIYDHPSNAPVAEALAAHPDRFCGWIFVNPRAGDAIAELDSWAENPGWVGVKAHPFWHRYAVRLLDDTAAWCRERGWPLLIHLGGDSARGDYRCLPERHPGLNIIYAHAAVPFYREVWDYARHRDGLYVDLSSPYLDEPLRRSAVDALGAEKCLYGSDGPYGYPDADGGYDHGHILREISQWRLPAAQERRILGDNFRELANL